VDIRGLFLPSRTRGLDLIPGRSDRCSFTVVVRDLWAWWGALSAVALLVWMAYLLVRNPRVGQGEGRVLVVSFLAAVGLFIVIGLGIFVLAET
jgi:hypothetical protein